MKNFMKELRSPKPGARGLIRWWWYGAAVKKEEIVEQLDEMAANGIGGVEIQMLYPLSMETDDRKCIAYFSPEYFDMELSSKEDLVGGDAKENAQITLSILKGEKGPRRNAVLLNSAAGLYVAGKVESLREGVSLAEEIIDSGKALEQLEKFVEITNS